MDKGSLIAKKLLKFLREIKKKVLNDKIIFPF